MGKNEEIKYNHIPKLWVGLLIGALVLAIIGIGLNQYYKNRLIPFEIEGSCNTGFIGIDYKSTFDNQPYSYLKQIYDGSQPQDFKLVKNTKYFIEYLPKELNIKNIDGLNCNFNVKGAISLNILQEVN